MERNARLRELVRLIHPFPPRRILSFSSRMNTATLVSSSMMERAFSLLLASGCNLAARCSPVELCLPPFLSSSLSD